MTDVLIKNEAGIIPLATAMTLDSIDSQSLRVTNIDPINFIVLGRDYVVGLDNNTRMMQRTCVSLRENTATFAK